MNFLSDLLPSIPSFGFPFEKHVPSTLASSPKPTILVQDKNDDHVKAFEYLQTQFCPSNNHGLHPYLMDDDWRTTVFYRYLNARSWDIKKSTDMLLETLNWRTKYKMDELPFLPAPKGFVSGYSEEDLCMNYTRRYGHDKETLRSTTAFRKAYVGGFHKWDKEGNPIYIERAGIMDPHEVTDVMKQVAKENKTTFEDEMLKTHLIQMELGAHLCKIQSNKFKKPIYQFIYINDLQGYGRGHLYHPIFNALKCILESDKQYYPETARYAFFVNAPPIARVAWKIIRPVLDKRTADKVVICGKDYHKKLKEVVDEEHLPEFLGGKCNCQGGCVPKF